MNNSQTPSVLTDDKMAFDSTVENNMGLVYSVARMFSGRDCELEDLIQIGAIGLIKAVKRFDKNFGVCFSTYAVPMISGEIRRFLRDDGIIKISRSVKENAAKGKRAAESIKKRTGKEPTVSEISEECGVPCEDLLYAFEACSGCVSMDAEPEDGLKKQYGISYEEETVDRLMISQALGSLPQRERQVIVLRYMKSKTQAEIAKLMGVSQVQVSRIEKKAIELMRRNLLN